MHRLSETTLEFSDAREFAGQPCQFTKIFGATIKLQSQIALADAWLIKNITDHRFELYG
jgi:hypothetical protein